MDIDDGGPAFPLKEPLTSDALGLSLRDYMAIHASETDVRYQGEVIRSQQISGGGMGILEDGWQVKARYMHADAMIKERSM